MLAIDGVAPRAKMNQQRSRRFRSSLPSDDSSSEAPSIDESNTVDSTDSALNASLSAGSLSFDTNCITPGTLFMNKVTEALKVWIAERLKLWPGLVILLTDASVPGEGEHKIMDFIRHQRTAPSAHPSLLKDASNGLSSSSNSNGLSSSSSSIPTYNANMSHVIYGLDADLIMLSLATHEPHFRVIREDVFQDDDRRRNLRTFCYRRGHYAEDCHRAPQTFRDTMAKRTNRQQQAKGKGHIVDDKQFVYLDIAVLREYLFIELLVPGPNEASTALLHPDEVTTLLAQDLPSVKEADQSIKDKATGQSINGKEAGHSMASQSSNNQSSHGQGMVSQSSNAQSVSSRSSSSSVHLPPCNCCPVQLDWVTMVSFPTCLHLPFVPIQP